MWKTRKQTENKEWNERLKFQHIKDNKGILYTHKLSNLEGTDRFLEKHRLPQRSWYEIDILMALIIIN